MGRAFLVGSLQIKDGELVLDTAILKPTLARAVHAACEKALAKGKHPSWVLQDSF